MAGEPLERLRELDLKASPPPPMPAPSPGSVSGTEGTGPPSWWKFTPAAPPSCLQGGGW